MDSEIEDIEDEDIDEDVKDFEINPNLVWICLIFISLGLIITASYLIYFEVSNAKQECENIVGDYEFRFFEGHFCNNKTFLKYKMCWAGDCEISWGFEEDTKLNVSEFLK